MPKLIEASKAKKNDSKISTMTVPKTMPVQNLLRYISFKVLYMSFDRFLWALHTSKIASTGFSSVVGLLSCLLIALLIPMIIGMSIF